MILGRPQSPIDPCETLASGGSAETQSERVGCYFAQVNKSVTSVTAPKNMHIDFAE